MKETYSRDFKPIEMMMVAAAREIRNEETVFVGFHWPIIITFFAKRTYSPEITLVFESGIVRDSLPSRLPGSWSVSDPCLACGATLCGESIDTLGMMLQHGLVDVGLLSASMVDRYGNINTTCVGPYEKPVVRLPGGGGATDVASLAKRLVIVLDSHEKRRLPEKVSFVTTPGYLDGVNSREKAGLLPETGPSALVTPLGVFRFNDKEGEMHLDTYHPGSTIDEIKRNTGWDLKVGRDLRQTEPPTEMEIKILREIIKDAKKMYYNIP